MQEKEMAFTFDYKTVKVKREMETIVCDAYESLGWELSNSTRSEGGLFSVNLSFKRNRKLENKMELNKIQEKIDYTISNIEDLLTKKKSAGTGTAVTVATIGVLTFGGGLSLAMVVAKLNAIIGGTVLSFVGAGICMLAYLLHKKINKSKSAKIQSILETEFDKLAELCENANKLL